MPDRKKLPARSKLTKRADLLRNAVRKNGGKRDRYVRGGIGEASTMENKKGDLSKFDKKPEQSSVRPLSKRKAARGGFREDAKLDPSQITDRRHTPGSVRLSQGLNKLRKPGAEPRNLPRIPARPMGGPSLSRHNKSERAADPAGPIKTRVAVVRGREQTVATGKGGAMDRMRHTAKPKVTKTPRPVKKAPPKRKTAGLGKGLRV